MTSFSLIKLKKFDDAERELVKAINEIHLTGPKSLVVLSKLTFIIEEHPSLREKYAYELASVFGLFFKLNGEPDSFASMLYNLIGESIEDTYKKSYTPVQASLTFLFNANRVLAFSAPTSAGKSFLLRELIKAQEGDVVVVLPSRALITEYIEILSGVLPNDTLLLDFVEDVNKAKTRKRVFVVTPERANELFRMHESLNLKLAFFDEAHLSDEDDRGVIFDSIVRRINQLFSDCKLVFSHPFIKNPEAQLEKHRFDGKSKRYEAHSVGKLFLTLDNDDNFEYFLPDSRSDRVACERDPIERCLKGGGTVLFYTAKKRIIEDEVSLRFQHYIEMCPEIMNDEANEIVDKLRQYIGATSKSGSEHYSQMINLMRRGIVSHHGSMPLKARSLVEEFVNSGFARICFSTSTLSQGINMPFDLIYLDNNILPAALPLKNLIGRAGRLKVSSNLFDYGTVVIPKIKKRAFLERLNEEVQIKEVSSLEEETDPESDNYELADSIRNNSFNDEYGLPQVQVNRLISEGQDKRIKEILDKLMPNGELVSASEYYALSGRKRLKENFSKLFGSHISRDLNPNEKMVISAAIPILLWRVKGKSFGEIVSMRYSYIGRSQEVREIRKLQKAGEISEVDADKKIDELKPVLHPMASKVPNQKLGRASIIPKGTNVEKISYDLIVFDTYDYIDKVISMSFSPVLTCAFNSYYERHGDVRAKAFANFTKYGTNDDRQIMLLRYGFDSEDINWITSHIDELSEEKIVFKNLSKLSDEKLKVISRYI